MRHLQRKLHALGGAGQGGALGFFVGSEMANQDDDGPHILRFPTNESSTLITPDQLKRINKLSSLAGWDSTAKQRWLEALGIGSIGECSHSEAAKLIEKMESSIKAFGGNCD